MCTTSIILVQEMSPRVPSLKFPPVMVSVLRAVVSQPCRTEGLVCPACVCLLEILLATASAQLNTVPDSSKNPSQASQIYSWTLPDSFPSSPCSTSVHAVGSVWKNNGMECSRSSLEYVVHRLPCFPEKAPWP